MKESNGKWKEKKLWKTEYFLTHLWGSLLIAVGALWIIYSWKRKPKIHVMYINKNLHKNHEKCAIG